MPLDLTDPLDATSSYVPAAAADRWTRTLGWFARNLA
jgi:dienelactone hydrolase